jgi:hypothetical protein
VELVVVVRWFGALFVAALVVAVQTVTAPADTLQSAPSTDQVMAADDASEGLTHDAVVPAAPAPAALPCVVSPFAEPSFGGGSVLATRVCRSGPNGNENSPPQRE